MNNFGGYTIKQYLGNSKIINIPSEINGKGINVIERDCFRENLVLEKINIPSCITDIRDNNFRDCLNLKEVNFLGDSKLCNISLGLFQNCVSLKSINLPGKIRYIDLSAFESCSGLESIVIPHGVEEIMSNAFYNCQNLETITLPDTLKVANNFCKGTKVEELVFPSSVTSISSYAFEHNFNLKRIIFNPGLKIINAHAFEMSNCEYIVIPNTVVSWSIEKSYFSSNAGDIFYYGTKEDFSNTIWTGTYTPDLTDKTNIHFYSETYLENGWHYVNNKPVIYS